MISILLTVYGLFCFQLANTQPVKPKKGGVWRKVKVTLREKNPNPVQEKELCITVLARIGIDTGLADLKSPLVG